MELAHDPKSPRAQGAPCASCRKPAAVCVCARIEPFDTRLKCLVLQHPQEQDLLLGSVPLLEAGLPNLRRVVGLSWPSLEAAVGEVAADPARWGILYPQTLPRELAPEEASLPVVVMGPRGQLLPRRGLAGIIALDGTWSQAKTLWWRNPWMLRLPRVIVQPREPSIYGKLRREPRPGCVSTLEAVTDTLVALGEDEVLRVSLRRSFRTLAQRVRDFAPAPQPSRKGARRVKARFAGDGP